MNIVWLCLLTLLSLAIFALIPSRTIVEGYANADDAAADDWWHGEPNPAATTKESYRLTCVVVRDGQPKVCVRSARGDQIPEAAALLQRNRDKINALIEYLNDHYNHVPEVKLFLSRVDPDAIEENLPTSEYTAVTTNKGEKIQFTLSPISKQDLSTLVDDDILFYVTLHELAHVMDKLPDHSDHFWQCMAFLIRAAKEAGLHTPVDYSKDPRNYGGDTTRSNPYFTLTGRTIGR